MKERLQKVLAQAGVASRRRAEEMIAQGRVQVNGRVIKTMGFQVNPAEDRIAVDGQPIEQERPLVYYMLNKPPGVLSTVQDDRGRATVMDLLDTQERVYPVGRLDLDSQGLILLTNDGDLTQRLTHPSYEHEKEYKVLVAGRVSEAEVQQLRDGIPLEDGLAQADWVELEGMIPEHAGQGVSTWMRLVLHQGRKRQLRRMFAALGHPVIQLIRVRVGPLELGDLPLGQARLLSATEIAALKEGQQQPSREL